MLTFVGDIADLSVASGDANHMRTRDFRLQAATIGLVQKDMTNTMGISYHKVKFGGAPKTAWLAKPRKLLIFVVGENVYKSLVSMPSKYKPNANLSIKIY